MKNFLSAKSLHYRRDHAGGQMARDMGLFVDDDGKAYHIFGPWTDRGDPCIGPDAHTRITFESQSTFVLPVQGKPGAFIYMGDRWRPSNPIDATHVWLPVLFDKNGKPFLEWMEKWHLGFFDSISTR